MSFSTEIVSGQADVPFQPPSNGENVQTPSLPTSFTIPTNLPAATGSNGGPIPVEQGGAPVFIDLNAPSSVSGGSPVVSQAPGREKISLSVGEADNAESITISIVPPASTGLIVSTLSPPSPFSTSILSVSVVSLVDLNEIHEFDHPVEICFSIAPKNRKKWKDEGCLSYENEEGEWICQDKCLNESSDGSLWFLFFIFFFVFYLNFFLMVYFLFYFSSGNTDHFSNFAILLDGYSGGGDCEDNYSQATIGWLSMAFIIVALVFVAVSIGLYEIKHRKELKDVSRMFKRASQYGNSPPTAQSQPFSTQPML